MKALSPNMQRSLGDLIVEMHSARQHNDLGRLALLACYEVRRWARMSGASLVAESSNALLMGNRAVDRAGFLRQIDQLLSVLEGLHGHVGPTADWPPHWRSGDGSHRALRHVAPALQQ